MSTIKKAFLPLHTALTELEGDTTVASILANPEILKLMEASKGGFSGESNFVEVDGQKVGRICAMTGAVYTHNNSDKEASFFYKNGSYMIGAEIVKANARKAWEAERGTAEADLETQMLDGDISPKEWKEAVTALKADEFTFELDADTKAQLVADYDGYETKEAFTTAYNADELVPFSDYQDITDALREAGKPTVEAEPTVEA